jgi:hypothetical protein
MRDDRRACDSRGDIRLLFGVLSGGEDCAEEVWGCILLWLVLFSGLWPRIISIMKIIAD